MVMPSSPIIDVAAALIFHEDKLLIAQRYPDSHLGGLWEFPGGKREPDESFEQCLRRELREELGIEVSVGELIESLTHEYSEKRVYLQFFRCQWTGGSPEAIGCPDFKWVSAAELRQYSFPAADARLLDRLQNDKRLWNPRPK